MNADERIPAHKTPARGVHRVGRPRVVLMSPAMIAIGGMLAFLTVVAMVVVLPTATYNPPPSNNWLPLSNAAVAGRETYLANGCVYCHSGFSRPQDTFVGQYYLYPRVSEPGDYFGESQSPNILGSERTGPDLSQEGGNHPDSWHVAHYENPRFTNPNSIMPKFSFLSDEDRDNLIAFNQASGGKEGVLRYAAVTVGNKLMQINAGVLDPEEAFPDLVARLRSEGQYPANVGMTSPSGLPWPLVWHINSFSRSYWLTTDPLPLTQQNLIRGREQFMQRCVGCHGITGDGDGPAAEFFEVQPFAFTRNDLPTFPGGSDGMFYHRILTAGPGTAMENFGTRMSVEDIWRVVLFLRTIPNGGLTEPLPTVDMYEPWQLAAPLERYISEHPLTDLSAGLNGPNASTIADPFAVAARWVAPGMTPGDEIFVGGMLPMTLDRLEGLIRDYYFSQVQQAYDDAVARGEDLPPRDQVFSVEGVTFHAP